MQVQNFEHHQPLTLEVQGNDVVVHGDANRTAIQIVAPNALSPVEPVGGDAADGLRLQVAGPVTVKLPAEASFTLAGSMDDVVLRRLGEVALSGKCSGDLVASELSSLKATQAVSGDIALRKINDVVNLAVVDGDLAGALVGSLLMTNIKGDITLSEIKAISIQKIEGDLSITHAENVQIQEISGDATLNDIRTAAALGRIKGDLSVMSPGAQLAVTEVKGDAELNGLLQNDGTYWINANGDIAANVDGTIRVAIQANGDIKLGSDWEILSEEAGIVTATLGKTDKAAELNLQARGDVYINKPGKWQRRHRTVVDIEMKRAKAEVKGEFKKAKIGDTARAARRMNQDQSGETMSEAAGSSVRDIVRDLLDALDTPAPPSQKPAPPTATDKAVDSSELQIILEMLEQDTISAEEAEQLIAALKS